MERRLKDLLNLPIVLWGFDCKYESSWINVPNNLKQLDELKTTRND